MNYFQSALVNTKTYWGEGNPAQFSGILQSDESARFFGNKTNEKFIAVLS